MKANEIQAALRTYGRVVDRLKRAGVIRSGKVVADYGEFIATKRLHLKLNRSSNERGYDAIGLADGKRYEIKARKSNRWNWATMFSVGASSLLAADFVV